MGQRNRNKQWFLGSSIILVLLVLVLFAPVEGCTASKATSSSSIESVSFCSLSSSSSSQHSSPPETSASSSSSSSSDDDEEEEEKEEEPDSEEQLPLLLSISSPSSFTFTLSFVH